jgi:hypothetical protein
MTPSHPRRSSDQGSNPKPKSRNVTPSTPTSIYPIPPLGAIFLTHFHDTKGQNVVHYISNDDTSESPSSTLCERGCREEKMDNIGRWLMIELGKGTIEHTTFPSGLHVLEEDFFGFRHGSGSGSNYDTNESQDQDDAGDEAGDGDGDGGRDRGKGKGEGKEKGKGKAKGDGTWPGAALFRSRITDEGRGRRMITLGVVLGMSPPLAPSHTSSIYNLGRYYVPLIHSLSLPI